MPVARSDRPRRASPTWAVPRTPRRAGEVVRLRPALTARQLLRKYRVLLAIALIGLTAALVPHAIWLAGLAIAERVRWTTSIVGGLLLGLAVEYAWLTD